MTSGGNGSLSLWKYNYPAQRATTTAEGDTIGVVSNSSSIVLVVRKHAMYLVLIADSQAGTTSLLNNITIATQV